MAPDAPALISRRTLMDRLAILTLYATGTAIFGLARPAAGAPNACVDPAKLTDAEIQLRQSLGYADPTPEAGKVCGRCAFFKPADSSKCGNCEILSGPTSATGYCSSWAAGGVSGGLVAAGSNRPFVRSATLARHVKTGHMTNTRGEA